MTLERWRRLLPGLWAGGLLCVALLAAPSAFATLLPSDAGRMVACLFAQEAHTSLVIAVLLLLLQRAQARRGEAAQFGLEMALVLGTIACTVAGYFVVVPMMEAARFGQGTLGFGQWHALSMLLFAVKGLLVLALAWRAACRPEPLPTRPASS